MGKAEIKKNRNAEIGQDAGDGKESRNQGKPIRLRRGYAVTRKPKRGRPQAEDDAVTRRGGWE
jgi:hypothetical protein